MMITKDDHGRFYDFETVIYHMNDIMTFEGFDRYTASEECCNRIRKIFDLENKQGERSLRAIRNAAVSVLTMKINEILHINPDTDDYEEGYDGSKDDHAYEKITDLRSRISVITAVLDKALFENGYNV